MKYQEANNLLIPKLEKGLPSHITYHNVQHTKYVIKSAELIAEKEKVIGDDLILLKTAALFHDAGFLKSHIEHEALSCEIARELLPKFDYNPDQIEHICEMIMATKLPQKPHDHLAEILCDSDLYYLGSAEYEKLAENLFKEFKANKILKEKKEWLLLQKEFLSSHHYFTKTARHERDETKKKKLHIVKEKLKFHISKDAPIVIIQDAFLIIAAVIISGIALKGFLVPNQFFDGGISGIALLVSQLFGVNLSIAIIALNLPLIVISYFSVGKKFAIRTLASIFLLSICYFLLPDLVFTEDKLLISIFGGIFLGIGIGLGMRAGAALDGIDVLALYTFKKTSFSMTEIVMGINILIFSVAAFQFGIEIALYSILTYFAASISLDYVVEGLQAHIGVTIISSKSEDIKYQLVNELGRGITVYKGERGFLPGKYEISSECDIIFTVISRLEMRKLKNLVYEIDENAFVFANSIKEASGGIVKKIQGY